MTKDTSHTRLAGGCLCESIRYEIDPATSVTDYCHCADCRKASGGITLAWVQVPAAGFRLTRGEPVGYSRGGGGTRWHCGTCGAHTHATTNRRGGSVGVTVGTLDEPEAVRPVGHGFDGSRPSWLVIADDAPRFPGAPPYDLA